MITLLQSGRNYSPDELASELEVSRRTVFRDLNVLEMARIPYFFDPDHNGYRINGHFFLPPINLDLPEALAVLVLTSRLRGGQKLPLLAEASRAAMKIEAALPTYVRKHVGRVIDNFAMRIGPLVEAGGDEDIFNELANAIASKKVCRVTYQSFYERKQMKLRVHPYQLAFLHRAWYLLGYSEMHKEVRTFKLSRIDQLFVSTAGFEGGDDFQIDEHFGQAWQMIPEGQIYDVHLRFAAKVAGNVSEVLWHCTQQVQANEDGSVDYRVQVDGLGEISWWILGYGDQVEVLAPAELRSRIGETASRMAAMYNSDAGV
ncbi:MAG: helix-turn-helix transcriptional regulator [Planctomycetota bacterium]